MTGCGLGQRPVLADGKISTLGRSVHFFNSGAIAEAQREMGYLFPRLDRQAGRVRAWPGGAAQGRRRLPQRRKCLARAGVLHYRLDLAEFAPRDLGGYFRVNDRFAAELAKIIAKDDLIWVHDYHLIPIANHCASRPRQPDRVFPACSISPTRNCDRTAEA